MPERPPGTWFYTLADCIILCNNPSIPSTGFYPPLAVFLLWHASWPTNTIWCNCPCCRALWCSSPLWQLSLLFSFWADNCWISAVCKQECYTPQFLGPFDGFDNFNGCKVFPITSIRADCGRFCKMLADPSLSRQIVSMRNCSGILSIK